LAIPAKLLNAFVRIIWRVRPRLPGSPKPKAASAMAAEIPRRQIEQRERARRHSKNRRR